MGRIEDLEAQFRVIGASTTGTWTAALTDLTTGEHIAIDERRPMPPMGHFSLIRYRKN